MADAKNVIWGTGRRKTAVARVRLVPGNGTITINDKPADEFFVTTDQRGSLRSPLVACDVVGKFDVHARVNGGGPQGQADAVRHGLARALVKSDETLLPKLREAGHLTRDDRRKERKKYGQRGARARFQFSKR
ncbi:MAG: 30S ribosomal protein S9 [Planctomycetota bacterium]